MAQEKYMEDFEHSEVCANTHTHTHTHNASALTRGSMEELSLRVTPSAFE